MGDCAQPGHSARRRSEAARRGVLASELIIYIYTDRIYIMYVLRMSIYIHHRFRVHRARSGRSHHISIYNVYY